jgi:hypothetical protein
MLKTFLRAIHKQRGSANRFITALLKEVADRRHEAATARKLSGQYLLTQVVARKVCFTDSISWLLYLLYFLTYCSKRRSRALVASRLKQAANQCERRDLFALLRSTCRT